jgi:N-acetylmuramic acid 6-phosphate etherase
MKLGGRLFYWCWNFDLFNRGRQNPYFWCSFDLVNGIIAGGDIAIRKAVENAEDNALRLGKIYKQNKCQ